MERKLKSTLITAALLICFVVPALAQESGQKTFSSPEEAAKALYQAAKADDAQAVLAILGPSAESLIHSGDAVQDKNAHDLFIQRCEQMNRIGKQADGSRVLYVGADNWPFPIPLVNKAGQWYFDTAAGKQEVLFRRIGKNELAALRVLQVLFDAQGQYFDGTHDGVTKQYATRIISTPGKQDGLFWQAAEGQPESPIGPLIAYANKEGYTKKAEPFHGYFYRPLTGQGTNVAGGAKPYLAEGKVTGFAFIAYPAEYRNSGVMTFVVDASGVVYEKDLGPDTATVAAAITAYNPDKTWTAIPASEVDADDLSDK